VLATVLVVAGLVLLALAADQLVIGSGRLAARLRVAPVVIGVVVIGLGTSTAELLVSTLAALRGQVPLGVGTLVGSNVVNVTLLLGVTGLIGPFPVRASILRREARLSVLAVAVFALLLLTGVGAVQGIILAVFCGAALLLLLRWGRKASEDRLAGEVTDYLEVRSRYRLPREAARVLLGLAGTLAGADLLLSGGSDIATRAGVPQVVIGFTVLALGTSLPELATCVHAQRRGETELIVGDLLGSNLFNSLAGGAAAGLASWHNAASGVRGGLLVTMVGVNVIALLLLVRRRRLTRPVASVLLAAYGLALPMLPTTPDADHPVRVTRTRSARVVHHGVRRHDEVVPQRRLELLRELQLVDGGAHVRQPGVALCRTDREGRVPHAQPGMAALFPIGPRAAPVLDEEEPEPLLGGSEVLFRIERAEHRVRRDVLIEPVDEPAEGLLAADRLEECHFLCHGVSQPMRPRSPP
jgi:cation:H+ antiporter